SDGPNAGQGRNTLQGSPQHNCRPRALASLVIRKKGGERSLHEGQQPTCLKLVPLRQVRNWRRPVAHQQRPSPLVPFGKTDVCLRIGEQGLFRAVASWNADTNAVKGIKGPGVDVDNDVLQVREEVVERTRGITDPI